MGANTSDAYEYSEPRKEKQEKELPAVESCDPQSLVGVTRRDEFFGNQSGVVYIKTLGGLVLPISADPGDLIETIKEKIKKFAAILVDGQNCLYAGQKLRDDRSLSDYNIRHGATIHLLLGDEDPMQMILESQSAIQEGHFEMNVLYQTQTFPLKMKEVQTVKDLKIMIANTILCPAEDFVLLYGGKLLLDEEKDLISAKIENKSNIIVIPTSDGGDCLRFTQLVLETVTKDLTHLKSSLDFLNEQKRIEKFLTMTQINIKGIKKAKPEWQHASEEGLAAIMLWTSDLLYSDLNKDLRESDDFSKWKVYLKNLLNGLKSMPFFRGKVYRGFKDYQDLKTYRKGKAVTWKTISGLLKDKEIAKRFSNAKGTIFEVEVYSSRDISSLSEYADEEEVLMLPYSCFEVIDVIEKPGEPVYIKLKEIPTPRALNVIFWIGDEPENNHSIAKEVEQKDISCMFCVSTNDALKVIEHYRWLLYLENEDFKIVLDMVRFEKEVGAANYEAEVDLVEKLYRDFQYNFEVLIFCGDVKRAQESCDARKLKGRFSITSSKRDLQKFLGLK